MTGRRRMISLLGIVVVLGLVLAACGDDADDAPDETVDADPDEVFEWDYVLFVGLGHHFGELAQEFAEDVRERTDGRIDITVRPAGELPYSADEYLRRTGDGSIAISDSLATFIAGDCRVGAMPALPMLVPGQEEWEEMWPTLEPHLETCLNEFGAALLYPYLWPTQNLWGSGDPVQSLDDIAGLTIRQTSPEHGAFIEDLGGEAVTLTTEEVPPAIQRGVMDGVLTAALNLRDSAWDEFTDWGFIMDLGIVPSYIVIDQDAFDSLPSDLQDILMDAAADATERNDGRTGDREDEAREYLESESGIDFNHASDADLERIAEMMVDVWEQWAAEGGPEVEEALEEVRGVLGR